jgi:uncharacterized protein YcgI (DUF1989 family)
MLSGSEAWLDILPAGSRIEFTAQRSAVGAAMFAWALADPYEQLSDAHTFMELRKVRPVVGDHFYSTLRRQIIAVDRDDVGEGIDLLRHDYWWPRDKCLDTLVEQAKSGSIPAPSRQNWPYAVNLFARTLIGDDGELTDDPVTPTGGDRIALRVKFDIVAAVMVAGTTAPAIEIRIDPA